MKKLLFTIAAMTAMTTVSAQKLLVLYYSETGTTKAVAEELQKQSEFYDSELLWVAE